MRPYPGNPCDPLIPRKDPWAEDDDNLDYLTPNCGKSLNVSGFITKHNVVDICYAEALPNPLPITPSQIDPLLIGTGPNESRYYICDPAVSGPNCIPNAIYFFKKINWQITFDLRNTQFPLLGNTQQAFPDSVKTNAFLNWYLNGTVYQSEKLPLNAFDQTDRSRIINQSGPLNKLTPLEVRNDMKTTLATHGVGSAYHNYLVACQKDIDYTYVLNILTQAISSSVSNLIDAARIAYILLAPDWTMMDAMGRALVKAALLIPDGQFDAAHLQTIFLSEGITYFAAASHAQELNELIDVGRDVLGRIGVLLQLLRLDVAESCLTSNDRVRLDDINPIDDDSNDWTMKYIPYSTLEDTTGEFTVSVIPDVQPTNIDGRIVAMSLTFTSPTDSRLYFPHARSAIALSEIISSFHQPILTPTPALDFTDPSVFAQRVTQHQGLGDIEGHEDLTPIQREYNSNGILIRNTEVRLGFQAPPAPYTPDDAVCNIQEFRSNQGDSLLGRSVTGSLTYYQLFHFVPELYIACAAPQRTCGNITNCVTRPCVNENATCVGTSLQISSGGHNDDGCCYGSCPRATYCEAADAQYYCVPQPYDCNSGDVVVGESCAPDRDGWSCCGPNPDDQVRCTNQAAFPYFRDLCESTGTSGCNLDPDGCATYSYCQIYCTEDTYEDGHNPTPNPGYCPSWPYIDLTTAARASPFSKTPFIEKLYNMLVVGDQSFFRRWMPQLPLQSELNDCYGSNPAYYGYCASFDTEALCTQNANYSCTWRTTPAQEYDIKTGDEAVPGASTVRYSATTNDLDGVGRVTAGSGGSTGAIYFPYLGSLSDHLLVIPQVRENLNLQRALRPKGFMPSLDVSGTTDPTINCNQNLPETNTSCVDRNNYIDLANRWYGQPETGSHAEVCYNDVVSRANAAGVNPGMSLLIWLNESDASNYERESPVEDFGIHVGDHNATDNFDEQITGHLETLPAIASYCASQLAACGGDDACKAGVFAAIYLTGNSCTPGPADIVYGNNILQVWSWISSCPFPFP